MLSTKIVTSTQKELLLNAGVHLVAYDAIKIERFQDYTAKKVYNHLIFTSQNAVRFFFESVAPLINDNDLLKKKCFCVGQKTKALLESKQMVIMENAENALALANHILENYSDRSFSFFCGNLYRNELPDTLKNNQIVFNQHILYQTSSNVKKFNRTFDGILFFSPSGVQSFVSENSMDKAIAFCIGKTTAVEAEKYTSRIVIANKPTVENVIVQAVKYSKNLA